MTDSLSPFAYIPKIIFSQYVQELMVVVFNVTYLILQSVLTIFCKSRYKGTNKFTLDQIYGAKFVRKLPNHTIYSTIYLSFKGDGKRK